MATLPSPALLIVVIGLLGSLALLLHFRRQARRRTGELRRARERYRHLFEEPAIAIIEEDFAGVVRRLDALRGQGVSDLRGHLRAKPELAVELFQQVRILDANRHAQALVGATGLEDYARRMRELTAARPPQAFIEELVALWDGRRNLIMQVSFQSGLGRLHTGALQWTLVDDPETAGEVRALLTFTDLGALQASEERFRELCENALEGIYEAAPGGGFVTVNPAMAELFGFGSTAEMTALGSDAVNALYASPRRRQEFYAEIEARGFVRSFESKIRRRDGTEAWVAENARVVRDAGGGIAHVQGFITDITPRKRAEEALRESEDRWRLAVQGAAAGIWENNFLTGETFYSDRSKQILGFAPHEISNRREDWTARIHPEDVRLGMKAMQEHLAGRAAHYEVEHRFRTKDGSYKWILSRGRALFDDAGRATRIVGTHLDIDERRRAEEELRASEARYRGLFEHSPFGIVEFDFRPGLAWIEQRRAEGLTDLRAYFHEHRERLETVMEPMHPTAVNAAGLKLVGAPTQRDAVAALPRIMTAEAQRARREFYLAVWEGRREYEAEITLNTVDGTPLRLHTHWWIPLTDGQPNYRRGQLALVDLTHLKTTELALEQERERLRVILRAMAEGVITIDPDGLVRFINEAACALLGCSEREAVGRPLADVCRLVNGATRAPLASPVRAAQAGNRSVNLPPLAELVQRDGGHLLVDGCCAPMHDQAGRAIGVVLVLRDISERSALEAEMQRSSKLESVGLLAGGIAHDFNNILAVVMGNLTLAMLDEDVKAGRAGAWLGEAEKATLRARDLTQQLLTFSKGGDPVRSSVQLPELVREAATFALHGANARCEFDIAADPWPAEVDKSQIGQVVQNLVLNAVQSMPQGGVIRIGLRNEQLGPDAPPPLAAGRYLRLTIRDQGQGISPQHLGRIFEPYFTTKPQGFGLGLATAYSVVKKHQGHIVVESELGEGTTFIVWLPAANATAVNPESGSPSLGRMQGRVLFMDDEAPIRQMAVALLARVGLETTTASDGAEAVHLYREAREAGCPFAVVVMDLTVPGGMGGRDAMQKIREIDPDVRAIVSSGYSSDPVMANFRAHGFCGMVAKPYRIADLIKAVREAIEGGAPE